MNILEVAKKLKVGQRAMVKGTDKAITRNKQGSLVWEETRDTVQFTGKVLQTKFELERKYISINEAAEAISEGEKVYFSPTKYAEPMRVERWTRLEEIGEKTHASIFGLVDGFWWIEGGLHE